jgi:hypothetical protein
VFGSAHGIAGGARPWSDGDAVNHDAAQATFRSCALWRKSSYSSPDAEECVQVITELPGWVGGQDSKLGTDSPVLAFTTARWQTILTGARAGTLLARPTAAQKTRPGADTRPGPDLPPKELTTSTNALACRRDG